MTGVPGQSLPSQMRVQQQDEGASAASESQADLIWAPNPAAHRWNTLPSLPECQCVSGGGRSEHFQFCLFCCITVCRGKPDLRRHEQKKYMTKTLPWLLLLRRIQTRQIKSHGGLVKIFSFSLLLLFVNEKRPSSSNI